MRKRTITGNAGARYLTLEGAMAYLSIGKDAVYKLADAAKAKKKIGRSTRFDIVAIDAYLAKQSEEV